MGGEKGDHFLLVSDVGLGPPLHRVCVWCEGGVGRGEDVRLEGGCVIFRLSALGLAQFLRLREGLSSHCGRLTKTK